ncbi:MAG: hypothetical protein ACJ74Z_07510 [Bryobacteraceae bacterium]
MNSPRICRRADIPSNAMDFDSPRIRMTIDRPTDSLNVDASGLSPSADLGVGRSLNF